VTRHLARYALAAMLALGVMEGTGQCNPEHGGGIGTHGGACKPLGARQVRSDGTTWQCQKGDPADYPYGTWVRTE
jgi:hypothetical protein